MSCKPDSTGADWFKCARGTVGCPHIHDGWTPHCIACTEGTDCRYAHDPPGLARPEAEYRAKNPDAAGRARVVRTQSTPHI